MTAPWKLLVLGGLVVWLWVACGEDDPLGDTKTKVADASTDTAEDAAPDGSADAVTENAYDVSTDVVLDAADAGCNGAVANTGGCSSAGWCWQNPYPSNGDLRAISATSATDVWAAGGLYIFHYDGIRWSTSFALLPGEPYHYVTSVWAASPTSVWATGDNDRVFRWNGSQWSLGTPTGLPPAISGLVNLSAIWGTSDADVWIGADAGLAHWNGTQWTHHLSGQIDTIHAIAGVSSNDVWATAFLTGDVPAILHFDGDAWTTVADGTGTLNMQIVWGLAARATDDVWFGGNSMWRWNGSAVVEVANPFPYYPYGPHVTAIWSRGLDDAWAFAHSVSIPFLGSPNVSPAAMHWDGVSWSVVPMPGPRELRGLNAVTAVSASEAWGVGWSGVFDHFDGTNWNQVHPLSVQDPTSTVSGSVNGLSGSSSDNIWAVGSRAIRFDGKSWTATPFPPREKNELQAKGLPPLRSVWTASPSHVWAVGPPDVLYSWTGTEWVAEASVLALANDLHDLSGTSATDVWSTGRGACVGTPSSDCGKILHYDGQGWGLAFEGATGETIAAISAIAPNDVWAVANGSTPRVIHWDGVAWTTVAGLPATGTMHDIWAFASNHVWIAARAENTAAGLGLVLYYDGATWTGSPMSATMYGVHGTSPTNVWVVGGEGTQPANNGVAAHWNGSQWAMGKLDENVLSSTIGRGVFSSECGTWAVGTEGLLVHHP
jgi:hypothetical protein